MYVCKVLLQQWDLPLKMNVSLSDCEWMTRIQPTESPPVGSQRCSSADRRSTSLRSRHWHSCQFSLASCSWAHQFQTGGPCVPSSARHCTSIPVWLSSPRCWLTASSSFTVGDFQPTWCPPVASVGDRSFASVGPKLWNSLPDDITSASSLPVFRKKLKTHLFQQSYPDIIL